MEPVNYQAPVYAQSCLSAAWADIKMAPNYVSRMLVLGLIMCVPILNFVVTGYLLFWAREVPFGGRTPLPANMVTGKNFEFGFYGFVLSLVVGIASAVVSGVLGWVPLIGVLVEIAVMLAVAVALMLMQMRMIMGLNLGDGFNLKDMWDKARRNWGQLLVVSIVPELVAAVILMAVGTVVALFTTLVIFGSAAPTIGAMSSVADPSFAQVMSLMGAIAGPMIVCTLIVYVVGCLIVTPAQVLSYRAMGHWVARYAPEWTTLPDARLPYQQP
ncbi:hypothetical protein [uncultured Adlercreutzia sp.]|uniref:hypothetical protein n=1 Tax=uncultured Adlercreutzia sp. TaxID=875803 RepID=UPI0025D97DD2|nr:hypothetical protein [uncultured Adlercreutzia sp.]